MSALTAHRRRLAERGLKRLEVRATPADAERLKAIAKMLAHDDAAARALCARVVAERRSHRTRDVDF